MIYPENALEKLGFNEIKQHIKTHCLSLMGSNMVDKISFITNYDQVFKFLNQTAEFKNILTNDAALPIQSFYDIKTLANKIRVEGVFLSEEEFYKVHTSLITVFQVISYFEMRKNVYPTLEALFENLPTEKAIIKNIETVIDEKGKIRSNASKTLSDLIASIAKAENEARKKIDQIYKNAQTNNWVADGSLTVREGRICIPLLSENKRKLKGFIHDESSSGQTVYIEPEEVFSLNNLVRDLEFDKRREIIKILTQLTDKLRPYVPILILYNGFLTKLDFVRAKALFAISIDAEMPILSPTPIIKLFNAQHPLLLLANKKMGKVVVPLNVLVNNDSRIVIISGPNAGGKSVAMKTIGLLQIMVQAGLLIPAASQSEIGIFKQLFADIGDDQSIESDLSTYSAHLSKMKHFTTFAHNKTLILIDEFGTGTDPLFGGPIAEAVLEVINQKNTYGVITTHYSNLKLFANQTRGLQNASMIFDNVNLQPMYMLEMGKPGSSYAFEIAQKIGLAPHIIELAKNKIGVQQRKMDTMLIDLERDKKDILDQKIALEKQSRHYKILVEDNEKQRIFYTENKRNLIKEAKLEAQTIIKNANKLIENTIAEIKENKAEKHHTQNLRANLNTHLQNHLVIPEAKITVNNETEFKEGDWVKMIDTGNVAQVLEVAKNNVILAFGDLRSVVKINRVQKIAAKEVPKDVKRFAKTGHTESAANFSGEIDIRGYRGDDALYQIEQYFDKAIMFGLNNFKIIHGKGDGILRKLIRNYLKKYPQVNRLEDEHADRGGDGITYVYLN